MNKFVHLAIITVQSIIVVIHVPQFHLLCDLLYCFEFLRILVFSFLCVSSVFVMAMLCCAAFGRHK